MTKKRSKKSLFWPFFSIVLYGKTQKNAKNTKFSFFLSRNPNLQKKGPFWPLFFDTFSQKKKNRIAELTGFWKNDVFFDKKFSTRIPLCRSRFFFFLSVKKKKKIKNIDSSEGGAGGKKKNAKFFENFSQKIDLFYCKNIKSVKKRHFYSWPLLSHPP